MNYDVYKDIVSQSFYFKSRPDSVKGGAKPKILENIEWRDRDETSWEK